MIASFFHHRDVKLKKPRNHTLRQNNHMADPFFDRHSPIKMTYLLLDARLEENGTGASQFYAGFTNNGDGTFTIWNEFDSGSPADEDESDSDEQ